MENNKLKVCFLIPSVHSGGIETYLLRFLNYLEDSIEVTVVVRKAGKGGELYDAYTATGAKLVFMPLGYLQPGKMLAYYRFFKANKFDVVCDLNANFAGLPMILSKRAGVKKRIAFYRQGSNHFPPSVVKNYINNTMNRLVYKHATNILSNSKAAIEFFFPYRKPTDTRFKAIYNGLNLQEYNFAEEKGAIRKDLGLPLDKFIVGHVGRLDPAKNHKTLLKSFQLITKVDSGCHFVLCGRNTEKLMGDIENLGIQEHVTILAYRDDVPRVLKSFDCFVFPSVTEGQPNALIEAMAAGIPIVASTIKPIKECVPEAGWGYLADALDAQALADLILKVKNEGVDTKVFVDFAHANFNAAENFLNFKKILLNE